MNILITGGAGFIGSHLCEKLLEDERNQIFCLDIFQSFYDPQVKRNNIQKLLSQKRFTLFEKDIRNKKDLEEIFSHYSFDLGIHLAAVAGVRPSIENPLLYQEINVIGTQNLLECSASHKMKQWIFASSSSVYGGNQKLPFSENDPVDQPISPYAVTKRSGELLFYNYHYLYEMNIAVLRFFTVYGPRQRPDLAIHKFAKLIDEEKQIPFFGDGKSKRDYTYIEDILHGIIQTINWLEYQKKPKYSIFNLGESEPVELNYLVKLLERYLRKKATKKILPAPKGEVPSTFADIEKSRKYLGYQPKTHIEDGIKQFVQWFLKEK